MALGEHEPSMTGGREPATDPRPAGTGTPDTRATDAHATDDLATEYADLHRRLRDAEETIEAIRKGAVDALLIAERRDEPLYTREGADRPYRFLVESMQQGALMLASDGTVLFSNGRVDDLLQLREGRLSGASLARHVCAEDRVILDGLLRTAPHGGAHGELSLQRADGTRIPVYVTMNPLPGQDAITLGAIVTDMRQQKQYEDLQHAQRALRESEARYRAAFEQGAVAMAEIDFDTQRVRRANPAYCALLGFESDQLRGLEHRLLVHPDDRERSDEDIQAMLEAQGPVHRGERRYRRKDGTVILVDVTMSIPRDREGRPIMGLEIVSDVTERRRTEELLRDADRRTDEFLATLAHELRNPLAPIRNAVEILGHRAQVESEVRIAHAVIDRQTQQLTRLVGDLLDLSRITRNQVALQRERVRVASIIDAALETTLPLIEQRGHQLVVNQPDAGAEVHGDAIRLTQVFANLLNNAAQYTDPGGRITVNVRVEGDEVVATVRDNGIGIPASLLPGVFDMFRQPPLTHGPSPSGGLGLGLGLVKRLVQMHGGSVEAESEGPGLGSVFTVRLPHATTGDRPAPSADDEHPRVAEQPRYRFLLVDDNADSVDTLEMLLTLLGHEVRSAYGGLTALAIGETFEPDVVLLDLGMPPPDGYETCRLIRERPWGRKALVIALTGWGQDADRRRTRQSGFDDHLVKPVKPEMLLERVARLMASVV